MSATTIPHLESIERLCDEFGVAELYAFGSSVEGGFDAEHSDFDFLVRFKASSPIEHADSYFGFLEALQDLLAASIDLVELDAVTNERFWRSVSETKIQIYAA